MSSISYGAIIDLTLNQYYDIETGDIGTLNSSMDFYCSRVTNIGVAHQIKPANTFFAYQSPASGNKTNIIGQVWEHLLAKDLNYNYIFTSQGNYARIHSTNSENGKCQFNSIGSKDSTYSSTPYFITNYTYAPVQVQSFVINGSVHVGVIVDSLSVFPWEDSGSINEIMQPFDSYFTYWGLGSNYYNVDGTRRSPVNSIFAKEDKQISYLTDNLNCNQYLAYNRTLNVTNWNDASIYAMCIFPTRLEPLQMNMGGSLTEDVQAILHLNENGSDFPLFVDSSGHDNNGACLWADCTRQVNGVFNEGQYFDYSAYRMIDLVNLTENPSNFTVSIWAKPNETAYIPDQKNIMITKSSSWLLWQDAGDDPYLWIWDQDVNLYAGTALINVTGSWHNIAFTVNSTSQEAILYVDGVNYTTVSMPTYSSVNPTNEAILLGIMGGYDQLYNGALDEVIYWNRTLTPSEIQEVYDKSHTLTFNDLAGGVMINETGNQSQLFVYDKFKLNLAYYNVSAFNQITEVSRTPQNVQPNDLVSVTWISTQQTDGDLFYRYSLFNTNSWSPWFNKHVDNVSYIHTAYINESLDGYTYQYYVYAGSARDNNNGSYYNYTVGAYGILNGGGAVPIAVSRLEASGFCSGSTCIYIFGFFVTAFVAVLSFFFGGVKNGAVFTASTIVVLAVIGLLPWFMLIPIVLYVVAYIMKHMNIFGGGD